jgi:hypothetical protein
MAVLAVTDEGAGVPVICLHSGGFTSRQWKRSLALYEPVTFSVLEPARDRDALGGPHAVRRSHGRGRVCRDLHARADHGRRALAADRASHRRAARVNAAIVAHIRAS